MNTSECHGDAVFVTSVNYMVITYRASGWATVSTPLLCARSILSPNGKKASETQ